MPVYRWENRTDPYQNITQHEHGRCSHLTDFNLSVPQSPFSSSRVPRRPSAPYHLLPYPVSAVTALCRSNTHRKLSGSERLLWSSMLLPRSVLLTFARRLFSVQSPVERQSSRSTEHMLLSPQPFRNSQRGGAYFSPIHQHTGPEAHSSWFQFKCQKTLTGVT